MNTTIYLIRHSIRFKDSDIEEYNTSQGELLRSEKSILSVEGEERAKKLSELDELNNIDVVYASNCVRTLQTAKYLMKEQGLKVNLDERLDERRFGKPNSDIYPNWFELQYFDPNFKTEGGESQIDVVNRFNEAFNEIVNKYKGKRIAVFSHGYAITFFLMQYIKLKELTSDRKFTFEYNGKVIFNKELNAPEVFKLTLKDDTIVNIEYIDFYKN